MSGDIWEQSWDHHHYSEGVDVIAPGVDENYTNQERTCRGGSFSTIAIDMSVDIGNPMNPSIHCSETGFRLIRTLLQEG